MRNATDRLADLRVELRMMTPITTSATAVHVTVSELKLEAFLPTDEQTGRALAGQTGHLTQRRS